ncbi:MAG: superoxide dismutase [Lachnospiraceae bacterium]|nr:superoxide dismutase [Lachnospiraceae bacterium]
MFEQVKLSYGYEGLEPHIDAATVETHYGKHHAAYTKTLNETAEKAGVADKSIEDILRNLDEVKDEGLRRMLKNHGGGYYNHNLYFKTLSPTGGDASYDGVGEAFKTAVERDCGGLNALKEKMSAAAAGQFGSGWAFLSVTGDGGLVISNSPNQDNPLSEGTGNCPIIALDVWEHAYYLKYRNLRADYIKAFWDVLDWKAVEALFNEYQK